MPNGNQTSAPLFAEERRERILLMLSEQSKLLVQDLCREFDVSPATIRTDLRELETAGRLRRTHGGAIPLAKAGYELTSDAKQVEHIEEKRRIARYAASLVEPGDIVALDSGTTMLEMARCLCDVEGLTVVTNDITAASHLDSFSSANVVLVGGMLRKGFNCAVGSTAVDQLRNLNVDKAFLGANAFSVKKGFTTPNAELADCKKALLSICTQSILLMDSSKMGAVSFVRFAELSDIDVLVCDAGLPRKTAASLEKAAPGLNVVTV